MTRAWFAIAMIVAAAAPAPAIADSHAEAVVLFDQGIKHMRAGQLDKACAELQASLDLVKDSGTKGALARCHGRAGRVASAWVLWRELADTAPSAELRADAAAQATRLEPRLPTYTVRIARSAPNVLVEINGRGVTTNVVMAVPIDPGPVSVRAHGRDGDRVVTEVWTRDYTAVEGQTLTIEVPVLAPRAAASAGPPASAGAPGALYRAPEGEAVAQRRHTRHVIARSLGGVALGVAAGGTYFGLDARSKYADARRLCGGAIDPCVPSQVSASQARVDRARSAATRSTVLFGVAGAAAVAAAVVWMTAPSAEVTPIAVAPIVGSDALGLVLSGGF